jgi:3-oxoacyl-[acyl-carrier protein] reductase
MKRVLVTGGSRGIGAAIVREFAARKNYEVVFTYKGNQALADELAASINGSDGEPGTVTAVPLDLNNIEQMKQMLAALTEDKGFDIVVHNAGSAEDGPFYFMNEDSWHHVTATALNSFYYINKACLEQMIASRFGRIITIVSISGESGNRGQVNYAAAKGALIAATKSLAKEVARKGVLVNAVSPGLIDTDMIKQLGPLEDIKNMIPMGRVGRPHEVAKVVTFLASDDASYINGEVIRVNGGLYT